MLDYLNKFNLLSKELKEKISDPEIMQSINDLEKRYETNLATLILRLMVKEIKFTDLPSFLGAELKMDKSRAEQLISELKEKVFFNLSDYLEIENKKTPVKIEPEIKLLERIPHEIVSIPDSSLLEIKAKTELEEEIEELAEELKKPESIKIRPLPVTDQKGPSFYFDHEDEEEIKKVAGKIDENDIAKAREDLDKKIELIISQIQISFSSQLLVERLRQILGTYLRDIRNRLDIKQTLAKPIIAGGLEFDDITIEKVLSLADTLKMPVAAEAFQAPKKITLPEDKLSEENMKSLKDAGVRDIEYDFASLVKNKPETRMEESKPVTPIEPPLKLAVADKQPDAGKQPEKIVFRKPLEISSKIRVEDVKAIPKTMGPIEEIKFLDTVNFRRLDTDPAAAALKVKEKISLLESEQYSKRFEAIKAWRLSPIYQLYLKIGEAAISQNASVDSVIEWRKKNNEEYLNVNEFEAIMSLNKELRF